MVRITIRMWRWIIFQRRRSKKRQSRFIRSLRNLRWMFFPKSQSWRRFSYHQKIIDRKQILLSSNLRHQKKIGLRFRNLRHRLLIRHYRYWWSFSYLRRNLVRRRHFLVINQTHQQLIKRSRKSQKSPLNDRCFIRFSLISQQRCLSWWWIIEQS